MVFLKNFRFALVMSIFGLMPSYSEANEKEITLGTFAYPPLMFEKRDGQGRQGIGIDTVKKVFENTEYKLKIKIMPVKRSMHEFEKGNTDLFLGSRLDLPTIKNKITAMQITTLNSTLFCLAKYCKLANSQKGAQNLGRVASIPGSPVNETLKALGNEVHVLLELHRTFEFLLRGRSHYVASIDFPGYYIMRDLNEQVKNKIEKVDFNLLEIPYDLVILKNHSQQKEITVLFKEKLKNFLKKDSQLLMKDYFSNKGFFAR